MKCHASRLASKNVGLSLGLLATAMIAPACLAQGSLAQASPAQRISLVAKTPVGRKAPAPARRVLQSSGSQTYTYTLLAFPGTLSTQGIGISPGAGSMETQVVGAWNVGESQTGFLARVRGTDATFESYQRVNDPAAPAPQQPYSINDFGTVVGDYIDAAGIFHGYEMQFGKFKPIEVPFAGAAGTYSPSINNFGQIAGGWFDGAGNSHGFTLINGVYTSLDYPGSPYTDAFAINGQGEVAGYYADTAFVIHGFVRRHGSYSSVDYPAALQTVVTGINDAGDVVGSFCLTAQCLDTGQGEQGFELRKGVYTAFSIPGENGTSILSINDKGVLLGGYTDAAGLFYTFLATP